MSDFNIQDMKEYIEEWVAAHALYNSKDLLFDCLHYYERVHKSKNISINFTTEQLDTILNSGGS